jgi:hypothetical protein
VASEESKDDPVELVGTLEAREMCGAGHRGSLCPGNSGSETICDAMDVGHILVAGQHESRDVHLAESLGLGRLEAQHPEVVMSFLLPERLSLHLADKLAHGWIHVVENAMGA